MGCFSSRAKTERFTLEECESSTVNEFFTRPAEEIRDIPAVSSTFIQAVKEFQQATHTYAYANRSLKGSIKLMILGYSFSAAGDEEMIGLKFSEETPFVEVHDNLPPEYQTIKAAWLKLLECTKNTQEWIDQNNGNITELEKDSKNYVASARGTLADGEDAIRCVRILKAAHVNTEKIKKAIEMFRTLEKTVTEFKTECSVIQEKFGPEEERSKRIESMKNTKKVTGQAAFVKKFWNSLYPSEKKKKSKK